MFLIVFSEGLETKHKDTSFVALSGNSPVDCFRFEKKVLLPFNAKAVMKQKPDLFCEVTSMHTVPVIHRDIIMSILDYEYPAK